MLLTLDLVFGNKIMCDPIKCKGFRWECWFIIYLLSMILVSLPELVRAHEHPKKTEHQLKSEVHKIGGGLQVVNAWIRERPPGATNSAAYVTIVNNADTSNALIAVTSAAAEKVELHTHEINRGVMKMRRVPAIAIPGNGSVKLQSGGDHMMLLGLKRSLKSGEHVMLTLKFRDREQITLKFMVMKSSAKQKVKHRH